MSEPLYFVQCASCRAKPGCPSLCAGCLNNREVIGALKIQRNDLLAALEHIATGPTTPGGNPETALELARDAISCSQAIARTAIQKAKGNPT